MSCDNKVKGPQPNQEECSAVSLTLKRCCGALQGSDKQSEVRIKKFMTMMDSMTEHELNTNDIKVLQQPTRVARISKGAGRRPEDYFELLGETH